MSMNQVPAFFNNWALNSLPLLSTLFVPLTIFLVRRSLKLSLNFLLLFIVFLFIFTKYLCVCLFNNYFLVLYPLSSVHPHRPPKPSRDPPHLTLDRPEQLIDWGSNWDSVRSQSVFMNIKTEKPRLRHKD